MMASFVKRLSESTREAAVSRVHDVLGKQPVGWKTGALLSIFGRQALHPVKFSDVAVDWLILSQGATSTIAAPVGMGDSAKDLKTDFPEIKAWRLKNIYCTPYASGVITGNSLALFEFLLANGARFRTDGGGLFRFELGHSLGYTPRRQLNVEKGILVGGAGAFNWYHFMIECLPKALLSQKLPQQFADFPLLVPSECRTHSAFSAALSIVRQQRPVIFVDRGEILNVKDILVIDEVSHSPFNLVKGLWPRNEDYRNHDDALREYSSHFLLQLKGLATASTKKRVFLARPKVRRNYNQGELMEIASRYGFEAVSPENLSLCDQARLFSDAEVIIGPSGAAWVGLLFAKKGTRALSWLPPEYAQFCSYSTLALMFGVDMIFIPYTSNRPIRSSDDAYLAEYTVNPDLFQQALDRISSQ